MDTVLEFYRSYCFTVLNIEETIVHPIFECVLGSSAYFFNAIIAFLLFLNKTLPTYQISSLVEHKVILQVANVLL